MKTLTTKLFIFTNDVKAKIKNNSGDAGQWVIVLVVGVILALFIGGIVMTFFKAEVAVWLDQIKGKVGEFFNFI